MIMIFGTLVLNDDTLISLGIFFIFWTVEGKEGGGRGESKGEGEL